MEFLIKGRRLPAETRTYLVRVTGSWPRTGSNLTGFRDREAPAEAETASPKLSGAAAAAWDARQRRAAGAIFFIRRP